jgi:predicted nucleic acid-binding protein
LRTLVDSNVLIARADLQHSGHLAAIASVDRLLVSGEELFVMPQNIAEFWRVATTPRGRRPGGLGLTAAEARLRRENIKRDFTLLHDAPALYDAWECLVDQHDVIGLAVFDARLVAAMQIHRLDRILTFNISDFARYGVSVLDPKAGQ